MFTAAGEHAELVARVQCSNDAHAAVLVSVHLNAAASPDSAGMLTTVDDTRPFGAANRRLAGLLQTDILRSMNSHGWAIPDGGIIADTAASPNALSAADASYGHLVLLGPAKAGYLDAPSTMPGAVIEPLFLTDPFEARIAVSPVGQRAIAQGIATAASEFLAGATASPRP